MRESDDYCPSCLAPRAGMAVFMLAGVALRVVVPWIFVLAAALILWKGERLRQDMQDELRFPLGLEERNQKRLWDQHQGQRHDDAIQKWINTPTR
ncbi:MAG: hypothetical protein AB9869_26735 [Verrucomicrobiia bacterium]